MYGCVFGCGWIAPCVSVSLTMMAHVKLSTATTATTATSMRMMMTMRGPLFGQNDKWHVASSSSRRRTNETTAVQNYQIDRGRTPDESGHTEMQQQLPCAAYELMGGGIMCVCVCVCVVFFRKFVWANANECIIIVVISGARNINIGNEANAHLDRRQDALAGDMQMEMYCFWMCAFVCAGECIIGVLCEECASHRK